MENFRKLAKQMRCGLYVDFGTDLESAFNAANILAGASREPAAVFTALYGVVNTLCNVIDAEVTDVTEEAAKRKALVAEMQQQVDETLGVIQLIKHQLKGGEVQ